MVLTIRPSRLDEVADLNALIEHCEAVARAAGFARTELMATLPGVPFYERLGYRALESVDHPLPDGSHAPFVRMGRAL